MADENYVNAHDIDPVTPLETIHRLCKLLYDVHERIGEGFADGPCDCFCPDKPGDPKYWRSTGDALRFVERVVRAEMLTLRKETDTPCVTPEKP